MIIQFATDALEKIIDRYLRLDPQTFTRLGQFEGKVILLMFTDWNIRFYLLPGQSGVKILHHYEGTADTTISGTTLSLLKLHRGGDFADATIEGDTELGQHFRQLLQAMDIDWEEQLAKIAGDVIAHRVANTTRHFLQWCKQATMSLRQDTTEFLQEETRQLPSRQEVEDFFHDVAQVRHDVERLEARFEQLLATEN